MIPSMSSLRATTDFVGIRGGWLSLCGRVSVAVVEQSLRQQPDQPGHHARSVAHRQVQRQHPATEGGPAGSESPRRGRPAGGRAGSITTAEASRSSAHSCHSAMVAASTPSAGGDHEQRRVRRPQAGPQLADEVGVAGRIQRLILMSSCMQWRNGQRHRPLLAYRGGVVVAHRGAIGDRARAADRRQWPPAAPPPRSSCPPRRARPEPHCGSGPGPQPARLYQPVQRCLLCPWNHPPACGPCGRSHTGTAIVATPSRPSLATSPATPTYDRVLHFPNPLLEE